MFLKITFRFVEFGAFLRKRGARLERGRFGLRYRVLEICNSGRQLFLRDRQLVAFNRHSCAIFLQAFMRRR